MSAIIVDMPILFKLLTAVHRPTQYNPVEPCTTVGGLEFDYMSSRDGNLAS